MNLQGDDDALQDPKIVQKISITCNMPIHYILLFLVQLNFQDISEKPDDLTYIVHIVIINSKKILVHLKYFFRFLIF